MHRKYFLELADYMTWANDIAIEWLQQISDEQWEQVITSSFSSIKQTVVHIVSAGRIWMDYWRNVPNPVLFSAEFKGTRNDLIYIWKSLSADFKKLIEEYPEENYLQPITFRWPGRGECQMEFWQTFSHFINHATYHRGQLVTLLRHAGFTNVSSTDLAMYYQYRREA